MSFLNRRRLDPKYMAGLVFLVAANFVRYLSPRMGIDDTDMFQGALLGLAIGLLLWSVATSPRCFWRRQDNEHHG